MNGKPLTMQEINQLVKTRREAQRVFDRLDNKCESMISAMKNKYRNKLKGGMTATIGKKDIPLDTLNHWGIEAGGQFYESEGILQILDDKIKVRYERIDSSWEDEIEIYALVTVLDGQVRGQVLPVKPEALIEKASTTETVELKVEQPKVPEPRSGEVSIPSQIPELLNENIGSPRRGGNVPQAHDATDAPADQIMAAEAFSRVMRIAPRTSWQDAPLYEAEQDPFISAGGTEQTN